MTIEINSAQLKIITDWAENIYPEECCGILLGKLNSEQKIVVEVIPTINDWQAELAELAKEEDINRTRHSRYRIPAQAIFQAQKRGHKLELEIIGFFHSHPDYPAIPSECDRDQAWCVYSYPIVSVIQGKAIAIESWVLDINSVFQSEIIQVVDRT